MPPPVFSLVGASMAAAAFIRLGAQVYFITHSNSAGYNVESGYVLNFDAVTVAVVRSVFWGLLGEESQRVEFHGSDCVFETAEIARRQLETANKIAESVKDLAHPGV